VFYLACNLHSHAITCVRNVPIFSGLNDEEMALLQQEIKNQTFHKGEYIFQEGETATAFYVIHTGMVKMIKLSDEGKEHILRLLFPGDFFGQYALFENKKHYSYAEVLEETTVCLIQKEDFKAILEKNPTMALKYMMALSERLQEADEWVGAISLLEVEKRLAKALLSFYDKEKKQEFDLPVSKKDFASLIGTTPETLSRKLVALESSQFLELKGRKGIHLLKIEELREIAR
jgi:CRP-like cAMP-binding protein